MCWIICLLAAMYCTINSSIKHPQSMKSSAAEGICRELHMHMVEKKRRAAYICLNTFNKGLHNALWEFVGHLRKMSTFQVSLIQLYDVFEIPWTSASNFQQSNSLLLGIFPRNGSSTGPEPVANLEACLFISFWQPTATKAPVQSQVNWCCSGPKVLQP